MKRFSRAAPETHFHLMLEVIEEQAEQGVDYMTISRGRAARACPLVRKRITGIVAVRVADGALMEHHKKQNFLLREIEEICRFSRRRTWIFVWDGLRPGCIADAATKGQFGS